MAASVAGPGICKTVLFQTLKLAARQSGLGSLRWSLRLMRRPSSSWGAPPGRVTEAREAWLASLLLHAAEQRSSKAVSTSDVSDGSLADSERPLGNGGGAGATSNSSPMLATHGPRALCGWDGAMLCFPFSHLILLDLILFKKNPKQVLKNVLWEKSSGKPTPNRKS